MKKIIGLTILTLVVVTGAFFAPLLINKPKLITPPTETGAAPSSLSPSEKEVYDELYNLLDKSEVDTQFFVIIPIPLERKVQIIVTKPMAVNKPKAQAWLKDNGYGNIPEANIVYSEATN